MLRINRTNLPIIIFAIGTLLATTITVLTLTLANPPQCPPNTNPQGSECIIGANIGLGLFLFLAIGTWVLGNGISMALVVRNILLDGRRRTLVRVVQSLLVTCLAAAATWVAVTLFVGSIVPFIRV